MPYRASGHDHTCDAGHGGRPPRPVASGVTFSEDSASAGETPPRMERERSILVVADHALTAALVQSLVEVAGMTPVFPSPGEPVAEAVQRMHPTVVVLDAAHASARDDALYSSARGAGSRLLLYAAGGDRRALVQEGARRGVATCLLPVPHREFTALLTQLIADPPAESR